MGRPGRRELRMDLRISGSAANHAQGSTLAGDRTAANALDPSSRSISPPFILSLAILSASALVLTCASAHAQNPLPPSTRRAPRRCHDDQAHARAEAPPARGDAPSPAPASPPSACRAQNVRWPARRRSGAPAPLMAPASTSPPTRTSISPTASARCSAKMRARAASIFSSAPA